MTTETAFGEVVNIGATAEISIRDLAQQVRDIVNDKAAIEYIPYTNAYGEGFEEVVRRLPDLTKLKNLTDFTPTMAIDDIIRGVFEERKHLVDN